MDELWMMGLGGLNVGRMDRGTSARARSSENIALETKEDIRELRHQVERLSLLNQALWELLQAKAGFSDADLEQKAHEIDLRDGVADGKMGGSALTCPTCRRVSNAKHYKCLYCGELFEKPLFG